MGESHEHKDERKKPDTEEYRPYDSMRKRYKMAKMNLMLLAIGIVVTFRRGCDWGRYEKPYAGTASSLS